MTILLDNETNIPSGPTFVSDTWRAPKKAGGSVRGVGAIPNEDPASVYVGDASQLIWTGPLGLPMLEVLGTNFEMDNFSLHGLDHNKAGNRAGIGLYVWRDGSGLGSGKHTVRRLVVTDCTTGIQFGASRQAPNADETIFDYLQIEDCDVAFSLESGQAMGFHIDYYKGGNNGKHFSFPGGGIVSVQAGRIISGTLAHFPNVGTPHPGSGNASYVFRNILLDDAVGTAAMLLDIDDGMNLQINISFDGCHITSLDYQDAARLAVAKGQMHVVLRGCINLQRGCLRGMSVGARTPVFSLSNNRCVGCSSLADLFTGTQYVLVDGRGNHDENNNLLS